MSDTQHFGDTSLGAFIGVALIVLALCIGVGTCNRLQMTTPLTTPLDTVSTPEETPILVESPEE